MNYYLESILNKEDKNEQELNIDYVESIAILMHKYGITTFSGYGISLVIPKFPVREEVKKEKEDDKSFEELLFYSSEDK